MGDRLKRRSMHFLHKERIIMTENRLDINQEEAPKAPPAKKRNPIFDIQLNKKAIIPLILLACSILLILVNDVIIR